LTGKSVDISYLEVYMNGAQCKSTIIGLCVAILGFPLLLRGQGTPFPFEWSTRPKTAGQTVDAPSISIATTEQVTFTINHVNDIFYNYKVNWTERQNDGADLSPILGILFQRGEAKSQCETDAGNLLTDIQTYLKKPSACGKDCASIPLVDTEDQINSYIKQIDGLKSCASPNTVPTELKSTENTLRSYLKLDHFLKFTHPISPDKIYTCTVTEYYEEQPTKDGSLIISVQPENSIVTLSLGPVISTLQNRSYSAVTAPNGDSSGTSTVLAVQGSSISSSIAALVNFRLPIPGIDGPKWGFDLAAGPVIRLNSQSGTSAAGFFGGISVRLYRYFFVTPGFYVGEFADFPQGFNRAGQPIPPNFGTLAPVKRTSAKFGIALTYRTKDFSSLGKSTVAGTNPPVSPPSQAPAPGAGAKQPVPAPSPAPAANKSEQPSSTDPISIDPATLDFEVRGSTAITKSVKITNVGKETIKLNVSLQDSRGLLIPPDTKGCALLDPGKFCNVTLTLNPGTEDPSDELLIIKDTLGVLQQHSVSLTWKKKATASGGLAGFAETIHEK
jgi:hypothetical protein